VSRTDAASLVVTAPRTRVYAALVDPKALVQWLPPQGMSGRFERFDARPGGTYRLVLAFDDPSAAHGKTTAGADVVEGRFVELAVDERIVQAVEFVSDDPAHAGTMTMTWSLAEVDGGTDVQIRADNVPPGISADDHAVGMASSLANLAAYLSGRPRGGRSQR
jgi:uncharacterized protein YndB with AHSA1/START domain